MWIDLYGRACGLRDSLAATVSNLRPVLEPARRVFHPRAARADETSAGRLKRSRREPGIVREAGATTLLEGSQRSRLGQRNRERDHGARCLIAYLYGDELERPENGICLKPPGPGPG